MCLTITPTTMSPPWMNAFPTDVLGPADLLDLNLVLDHTWCWKMLLNWRMSCSPGRRWKVAFDTKAPQGRRVRSWMVTN